MTATTTTTKDEPDLRDYNGVGCPWCGSSADVDGDTVDIEQSKAYQRVTCLGCSRSWDNVYTFDHAITKLE